MPVVGELAQLVLGKSDENKNLDVLRSAQKRLSEFIHERQMYVAEY